jgi:hypothetical protein
MSVEVLCLRPRTDFERAEALPPPSLDVVYRGPIDAEVPTLMSWAKALVIPAVGPNLPPYLKKVDTPICIVSQSSGVAQRSTSGGSG